MKNTVFEIKNSIDGLKSGLSYIGREFVLWDNIL